MPGVTAKTALAALEKSQRRLGTADQGVDLEVADAPSDFEDDAMASRSEADDEFERSLSKTRDTQENSLAQESPMILVEGVLLAVQKRAGGNIDFDLLHKLLADKGVNVIKPGRILDSGDKICKDKESIESVMRKAFIEESEVPEAALDTQGQTLFERYMATQAKDDADKLAFDEYKKRMVAVLTKLYDAAEAYKVTVRAREIEAEKIGNDVEVDAHDVEENEMEKKDEDRPALRGSKRAEADTNAQRRERWLPFGGDAVVVRWLPAQDDQRAHIKRSRWQLFNSEDSEYMQLLDHRKEQQANLEVELKQQYNEVHMQKASAAEQQADLDALEETYIKLERDYWALARNLNIWRNRNKANISRTLDYQLDDPDEFYNEYTRDNAPAWIKSAWESTGRDAMFESAELTATAQHEENTNNNDVFLEQVQHFKARLADFKYHRNTVRTEDGQAAPSTTGTEDGQAGGRNDYANFAAYLEVQPHEGQYAWGFSAGHLSKNEADPGAHHTQEGKWLTLNGMYERLLRFQLAEHKLDNMTATDKEEKKNHMNSIEDLKELLQNGKVNNERRKETLFTKRGPRGAENIVWDTEGLETRLKQLEAQADRIVQEREAEMEKNSGKEPLNIFTGSDRMEDMIPTPKERQMSNGPYTLAQVHYRYKFDPATKKPVRAIPKDARVAVRAPAYQHEEQEKWRRLSKRKYLRDAPAGLTHERTVTLRTRIPTTVGEAARQLRTGKAQDIASLKKMLSTDKSKDRNKLEAMFKAARVKLGNGQQDQINLVDAYELSPDTHFAEVDYHPDLISMKSSSSEAAGEGGSERVSITLLSNMPEGDKNYRWPPQHRHQKRMRDPSTGKPLHNMAYFTITEVALP